MSDDIPAPTWPRRFMAGLPQIPDTALVVFMLVLVFVLGLTVGWALWADLPWERQPSVQQQLDALDTRLRTLEQR